MYYYIKGEYAASGENYIVVEAGGVGYKIYTSLRAVEKMPSYGSEVKIYTHFYVREDIQDLYGFPENDELNMFLTLISVSGVGPKAALSILSAASHSEVAQAVMTRNVKIITKASGVGPKLAERIILELKNKIKTFDALPEEYAEVDLEDNGSEAVSALVVLGFPEQEAKKAVGLAEKGLSTEEIVKEALKKLMK